MQLWDEPDSYWLRKCSYWFPGCNCKLSPINGGAILFCAQTTIGSRFGVKESVVEAGTAQAWRQRMLWTIFVILLVLWFLGLVSSYTLGGYIHILLVLAVIVLIFQLLAGRRSAI
jgi:uncharacterized membrane protein YtjA (UPF0391 family)